MFKNSRPKFKDIEQYSLLNTSLFLIITNTKLPIDGVFEKEYTIYHYLKLKNFLGEDPQTPHQHILKCKNMCLCRERPASKQKTTPAPILKRKYRTTTYLCKILSGNLLFQAYLYKNHTWIHPLFLLQFVSAPAFSLLLKLIPYFPYK